jgi:pimeloyl-ACP methyl ester carboxylesterase
MRTVSQAALTVPTAYNGPVLPLLRIAAAVALLLVALAALAWLGQRRLLYFPMRTDLALSTRLAARQGLEPWLDRSGAFVGWRAPHPHGAPAARAVVLHGNAGTALDRTYLRDVLQGPGLPRIEVLLLEYPGYGPRPGTPTQESIVTAGVEAVDLLGGDVPVFLVGESLGSAAAVLAAAARPRVAGLLLATPVASVTSLARRHYPFAPALLVRDPFRADQALPRYGGRVAFLLAGRDEVAPPDLARTLFEAYPGPKRLWEEEAASHNTLRYRPEDPLWAEVWSFLLV